MKLQINNELTKLNELFLKNKTPLYVVGGFVRDSLLQLKSIDIDLASKLKNEELIDLLNNTEFKIVPASKKLGTCVIKLGVASFEHTTFRSEAYPLGGFHTPNEVIFVDDIKQDAKRRDFTINSLYYDIQNDEVLDFFEGKTDLKQKTVKAIILPEYVFKSDGLRILRMIRIAAELGFVIDKKTYQTPKEMVHQLKDITKDRLYKEFQLILLANKKYGHSNLHTLEQLFELGALEFIFKNLQHFETKHLLKNLKPHLFYYTLPNNPYPFTTFYLDLAQFLSNKQNIKPNIILSKVLTLDTCGISKKERKDTLDFVKSYEQIKKCKNDLTTKKFIQDHIKELQKLLFVLNNEKDIEFYKSLRYNYEFMIEHKMPITLRELAVNGKMLEEELKLQDKKQIGQLLKKALKFCAVQNNNNTKAKILKFLSEEQKKEEKK
ncbi:MAG: hypothetical protein CVV59_00245 [Tenericutes bacterium HGW-Tenericutes-4]|nr:MAG: hypothetical protein CVV59_00245 [Tenericutes bacterium HGW-Tenericutes-4]